MEITEVDYLRTVQLRIGLTSRDLDLIDKAEAQINDARAKCIIDSEVADWINKLLLILKD